MAYVRSVREIPLDEEPMASALAAVLPDPEESPGDTELRWDNLTAEQEKLILLHPEAVAIVGGPNAAPTESSVGDLSGGTVG